MSPESDRQWDGRAFLAGGGDMGALIRSVDWSGTPIGPVERWSPSLRMMVSMLLANRFPLLLWWGPEFCQLYNDPYRPVLGIKHPKSLGQPARECWPEIWHIIGPLIETPFTGGPATWMEDIFLEIDRYGFVEETHFTIAYSPVPDETAPRGIGGVLATVHEITEKIIGERRIGALRELGARAMEAKTAEEACTTVASVLTEHARDLPFAVLYLVEPDGKRARLAAAAGIDPGTDASPLAVALEDAGAEERGWPLAEAFRRETLVAVDDLAGRFRGLPSGPWSEPPRAAAVVPIKSNKAHALAGLLVAGLSPRLAFDDVYRGFLELLAAQIATAIANARAYEEERRRAEALAEIDRAKTLFFSNVSHEFRTPLTLMLGPLEEALAEPAEALAERRDDLALVHRNGLRLLRLVNTLLDFSRIEAGRVQASYEPLDLAVLTAELASVFRSATERAGLALEVDCPPLAEPVWADRDMWEKIVLNLVSNAFKFTLEGRIAVRLRCEDGHAVLRVADTGTGIPAHELPRLFDRFHRVEGAQGRTQEGTGIGLALVQELAKLHGGSVGADSAPGAGSTFTVRLPLGTAHLPHDRLKAARSLASTALGAQPFVEEALRWLPGGGAHEIERDLLSEAAPPTDAGGARAAVLLADDNADMRLYVERLLADRYEVRTAEDGAAALAALKRQRADLLLSDVMMPRLDGFGLVRAVRADPALADMPIILLSARAGEEASVEGLEAGADDYLVKPFSARELLARVRANLDMARARRQASEALTQAYRETADILESIDDSFVAVGDDWRFTYVNHRAEARLGKRREDLLGQVIWDAFPSFAATPISAAMRRSMQERNSATCEAPSALGGGWVRATIYPGQRGLSVYLRDITGEKRGEQILLAQKRILELVAGGAPLAATLDELMRATEALEPGMICGLLLTEDGVHVRPGSGPNLPPAYREALHAAVGTMSAAPPYAAACAEAIHGDKVVAVPDVAREPKYAEAWRAAMLQSGLRACRSTPVHAADGRILGCLALYFSEPRDPNPKDARLVEMATHLAAIALERDRGTRLLQEVNATLEHRIAERTRELQSEAAERQKVEQALQNAQRLEAIGQLTGGVAHDFNNLLTVVMGNCESVLMAPELPENSKPKLAAIRRAAERGAQLTSQLLAFARRQTLKPQTVALDPIVTGFGSLLQRAVGEAITVTIHPAEGLWPVSIDPTQFEAAMLNLAFNARDAMPNGGRLTVRMRNASLSDIQARLLDDVAPGDYAVVSVSDSGLGMAPDVLRRCFEPFFTTKETGKGTGLGLSQVYGFARQSGGTASAGSAPGRGTTISLYLPRSAQDAAEAPASLRPKLRVGHGETILLVEDQGEVRSVVADSLSDLGYRVISASDGIEAKRALEGNAAIRLLLSDVIMPNGVSGIELARSVRLSRPDIKIVLMSGYPREQPSDLRLSEDWSFLQKPFRPAELATTVAQALNGGERS